MFRKNSQKQKLWESYGYVAGSFPIEAITRVGMATRPPFHRNSCRSRPGHLIHCMMSGRYQLTTNGRTYQMREGDVVYYHDGEDVIWEGLDSAVTFAAIGFFAPSLSPPPLDLRHSRATPGMLAAFQKSCARVKEKPGLSRDCRLYACLLEILGELPFELEAEGSRAEDSQLWWEIERWLRYYHRYRLAMDDLAGEFRCSASTITRACRSATGLSPMQRVKSLRMDAARGLLMYTQMNVSEVAAELGYPRMHEFSREFSQYYGCPPSQLTRGA